MMMMSAVFLLVAPPHLQADHLERNPGCFGTLTLCGVVPVHARREAGSGGMGGGEFC